MIWREGNIVIANVMLVDTENIVGMTYPKEVVERAIGEFMMLPEKSRVCAVFNGNTYYMERAPVIEDIFATATKIEIKKDGVVSVEAKLLGPEVFLKEGANSHLSLKLQGPHCTGNKDRIVEEFIIEYVAAIGHSYSGWGEI